MTKIIAVANQKGGVAKTTTTHNIGGVLAKKGYKVLMVDLDSQASLTISTGLEPYDYERNIVSVLANEKSSIKDCIKPLSKNLFICTSRIELAQLEMELISRTMRELVLKRSLQHVRDDYDYILIDCPPQLSILTINALSASEYVLIPVKTDYLAYRGVESLIDSIEGVKEVVNPDLKVLGVVATMYESRVKDDKEILQALTENYNVIGVVKKSVVAKKGLYDGKSIVDFQPNNVLALEYCKVAEYIINTVG